MTKMRVAGAADIEALLKQMPERLARNVTTNALRAGGAVIVKIAKANLRASPSIDSGMLEQAVTVKTIKRSRAVVGIKTTGRTLRRTPGSKPTLVRPSKYAHMVEFGTRNMPAEPFLRPALDAGGEAAIRKITEALGRGVEREARALASGKKSFTTGKKIG